MAVSDDLTLRRLRWRCRRGMRELDVLMLRYLDHRWSQADGDERAGFERLLETEDDLLWRWMMRREVATNPEMATLVERILTLPH
ncbi:MAG: hypothetical protein CVV14_01665 [Gammaproteobacteria bacterium HGW-Gammaproteobacteria-4]|jgi:antitoxin CptB|nr:MAG: hypothetical protein CVV14_01665 [Gammaproteobacteria bacterium HGW-Gammaproteobacteria-4]